ncbi:MAG: hypothetical protein ABEI52_04085, partial [Halobacteriaceae archaeon]
VMQQLAYEEYAHEYPEVADGRNLWLEAVEDMIDRGFDIQLHVHPQWHDATYDGEFWRLDDRWSLCDYSRSAIEEMISSTLSYLENQFPEQNIKSFRAGSWSICCPSRDVLEVLADHGITLDVSIVGGAYYDGDCICLDYTDLDFPRRAYHPDIEDARKLSDSRGDVVEIPTQSVPCEEISITRLESAKLKLRSIRQRFRDVIEVYTGDDNPTSSPDHVPNDPFGFFMDKGRHESYILDFANQMAPLLMKKCIRFVIEDALSTAKDDIYCVFENHTKDLQDESDFQNIETYIRFLQREYGDVIEFVTMSELADRQDQIASQALTKL